jgi:hypothetical protein
VVATTLSVALAMLFEIPVEFYVRAVIPVRSGIPEI